MVERLINTSKERGIDESKINNSIDDDAEPITGIEDKTPTTIEEKTIETPQDLMDSKKEYQIEKMSQEEIQSRYLQILEQIEKKQKVTEEEIDFKNRVDEAIAKSEQKSELDYQRRLLEEKEIELSKREEFLKEYVKTKQENPSSVIQAKEENLSLTGGTSLPKAIMFFLQMRKVKKKGGKVLVKVFRNKRVTIEWTNSDITYVEFITTDEKHNELIEVTRFNEFIYTYEGSPIPVLFAIQGVAQGYNFFETFRKDVTSEMVSRLTTRAYHAGYQKGAELVNPNKKSDPFAFLTPFLPIIMIVGFLILAYFLWQMYGKMGELVTIVNALKAASTAIPPGSIVVS